MDHEGHFIFTTAFRFVLFFQGSQGPGLPNQSTKLQNSNFPTYNGHVDENEARRTRRARLPPQEESSKSTLYVDGLRIPASSVAIA